MTTVAACSLRLVVDFFFPLCLNNNMCRCCVTGQAMPPPGTVDSGSDDPPSESSDTAVLDSKTYLVMSGGEGYIDFRMGEFWSRGVGSG